MMRHCNGKDPNLTMRVNIATGQKLDLPPGGYIHELPCDCNMTFDDDNHSVIWPHKEF